MGMWEELSQHPLSRNLGRGEMRMMGLAPAASKMGLIIWKMPYWNSLGASVDSPSTW